MFIVWLLALMPFVPFYSNDEINKPSGDQIKIMTYNIHFGQNNDGIFDIEGIGSVIKAQQPNIVAFQEVTYNSPFNGYTTMFIELRAMMESLGFDYYYTSEGYNYNIGNAIFSQYEIKSAKTFNYDDWNAWQRNVIEAIIEVNGIEIIVYTTHLTHIPEGGDSGEIRISEVNQLIDIISRNDLENDHIIVLGDFNIVTLDENGLFVDEYTLMTDVVKDIWIEYAPLEDGFTSPADDASKRIDFIFSSQNINATDCEVYVSLASDHLPVTCEVQFN